MNRMKVILGLAVWTLCLQLSSVVALEAADTPSSTLRSRNDVMNNIHNNRNHNENDDNASLIPHRLIFTYKNNMLETKYPTDLYNNVLNTIQVYADEWNKAVEEMDVMFIDDAMCLELIPKVEPRLLKYFQLEPLGSFKADICRVAALYLYGGYYFDVDIQALKALQPNPDTDFITSTCGNNQFFQAVMALSRQHPLARATLDSMLDDWYYIPSVVQNLTMARVDASVSMGKEYNEARGNYLSQYFNMSHEIKPMLGTATLRMAYDRHRNLTSAWILDELDNVDTPLYPDLKREETGWGCNYMVHDTPSKVPYFFSRCIGTDGCPRYKPQGLTLMRRSAIGNAMARRRSRITSNFNSGGQRLPRSYAGEATTSSGSTPLWWRKRKRPSLTLSRVSDKTSERSSTLLAVLMCLLLIFWSAIMVAAMQKNPFGQSGGKKNC
ncbi:unnamed protein product [Cylindrotheca closterium]|uniref:Alpha-1,4-N-acetylglucosaminyltransferase n=1 Tax=Cylindrotheca closterium TaxID=2856 RepID=A0AAD2FSC7_9STRA|nr:unnamed protein product [Cylindrotheca closterium]